MTNIKKNIVEPSWKIVSEETKLKKFYFLPWMVSVTFLTLLLVYQFTYTYVELFWNKEKIFTMLLDFFHSDYIIVTLLIWISLLLFYMVINPIFEIALINKIDCSSNKKSLSLSEAFWKSFYSFLPVFEYSNTFNSLKVMNVFNSYLFSIRFTGLERIEIVNYFFLFFFIISLVVTFLGSFTKYIIILEKLTLFNAFWKSAKLVLLNLWTTFKLYFLMFILNIRVILNFLIFMWIPIWAIAALTYIASTLVAYITIFFILWIWIILFLLISYISTILDIFKLSIWYYSYKEADKNIKRLEEE